MATIRYIFTTIWAISCLAISGCAQTGAAGQQYDAGAFVGSTPGDDTIRAILGIAPGSKTEFIKWECSFQKISPNTGTFNCTARYGVGKNGTNGFINGGEEIAATGSYRIYYPADGIPGKYFYQLRSEKFTAPLELIEMDRNIFYFADAHHHLLVGNGGCSYVLNRISPLKNPVDSLLGIFDGRTPCQELAVQLDEKMNEECTKIKWRLTLYRDPVTGGPGRYELFGFVHKKDSPRTGPWRIVRGVMGNPDAPVYQLDQTGRPPLFLWKADDNILFFLDRDRNLMVGNRDFSYTLNRVK